MQLKKILLRIFAVFLTTAFILLPTNVFAEKTDWSDDAYYFGKIKRLIVLDATSSVNIDSIGSVSQQKLTGDLLNNAKKTKCEIISQDQARQMLANRLGISPGNVTLQVMRDHVTEIADAWVQTNITKWNDRFYIVPERTVWETRRMGKRGDTEYYMTVPVTYPPYRVDVSDLIVEFELHDARTGKMVFGRKDDRSRDDGKAQLGMYGRMCNSFFEDLRKKMR